MIRSAHTASQPAAGVLAAFDIPKTPAADQSRTTSPRPAGKRSAHFANLLGGMVAKEEKANSAASASDPTTPNAFPPASTVQQSPIRFVWGTQTSESVPAPAKGADQQGAVSPDPETPSAVNSAIRPSPAALPGGDARIPIVSNTAPKESRIATRQTLTPNSGRLTSLLSLASASSKDKEMRGPLEGPMQTTPDKAVSLRQPAKDDGEQLTAPLDSPAPEVDPVATGAARLAELPSELRDPVTAVRPLPTTAVSVPVVQTVSRNPAHSASATTARLIPVAEVTSTVPGKRMDQKEIDEQSEATRPAESKSARPATKTPDTMESSPVLLSPVRCEEFNSHFRGGAPEISVRPQHPESSPGGASVEQPGEGSAPVPAGIAFTARLTPMENPPSSERTVPMQAAPVPASPPPALAATANNPPEAVQPTQKPAESNHKGAGQRDTKEQPKSSDPDPQSADPAPAPSHSGVTPSTTATVGSAQTISPGTPVEDTTRPTVQAADPGSREIVMSPSKTENTPGAPAHDIQLQFNQDGQRVDVRVSESSGEVRVAVRTPDSQLAGALRQDLPHLSSQLEQTGFRAETWHPGLSDSPASIERRTPANGSSLSDPQHGGQNQNRQEDQQQQQPRSPKPNATPAAKSQRREFQWLISQLR